MYEPGGHNGIRISSSSWMPPAGNHLHMVDQSYQFVHVQPTAIHRCVSTPFLGKNYSSHVPSRCQEHSQCQYHLNIANPVPRQSEMFATHHQPKVVPPNYRYQVGDTSYNATGIAKEMQELTLARCQEGRENYDRENYFNVTMKEKQVQKFSENEEQYWKQQYEKKLAELEEVKKKFSDIQSYLQNLETREEQNYNKRELARSEATIRKLEIQVNENAANNRKLEKKLMQKDVMVDMLQQKLLERHLEKRTYRRPSRTDVRDPSAENEELISKLKETKEALESEQSLRKTSTRECEMEIKEMKEILEREKNTVLALSEEIKMKDGKIENLKKQLKENSARKHSLHGELQELQQQMKTYAKANVNAEVVKSLEKQLLKEMIAAVSQMKNVAEFCVRDTLGEEMNISMIIGEHAPPVASVGNFSTVKEMLSFHIQEVKKIRDEIRGVHEKLSNNYAVRLGSQLSI